MKYNTYDFATYDFATKSYANTRPRTAKVKHVIFFLAKTRGVIRIPVA